MVEFVYDWSHLESWHRFLDLSPAVFQTAALELVHEVQLRNFANINFEPGDATRYRFNVSRFRSGHTFLFNIFVSKWHTIEWEFKHKSYDTERVALQPARVFNHWDVPEQTHYWTALVITEMINQFMVNYYGKDNV